MNNTPYIYIVAFFLSTFVFGQQVTLSKVEHYKENSDKVLYKVLAGNPNSEYLGEIEVQGATNNHEETFAKIYKKAKQIGANSFSLKTTYNIDDTENKLEESHYFLNLYYTETKNLPKEDNTIYIIASKKKQKISINNKVVEFLPKTYCQFFLTQGITYVISTRKLLGSTIKITYSPGQPVQYFQISPLKVSQNQYGTAGINLKSGDINTLDRSFAEFLTIFFKDFKIN